MLTNKQVIDYHRDGFLVVKDFFSPAEIDLLYQTATDESVVDHAFDLNDQEGKKTKLTLWFTAGDDPFGLMSRCKRMIDSVQSLIGEGEVCHFHSKVMQKEPRVGGAWEWHQDYGYWYKNGFLFPEAMISVMVALTDANKANGCLQVLRGTHKMQRFEHHFAGEQQGADDTFVSEAAKISDLIYCELTAGDVLFFHPNILHRSEANLSEYARWSVISAYNLSYNKPFREKHTSCITPVSVVSDESLLNEKNSKVENADFLRKEQEITLKIEK
ncbi:MAG: phytanoyl-CoA dioxygenase family protein [Saprospiraceae bacterium]|nr:phytanoyl-CoA dioxygenase family protein [Saprospiraceae bacterium]MDP4699838.1 phytanoyl-CoA dioxygenase family protein [Saprospiraceae bacterium]MDP4815624.1 phytanoyl-CoA dioxygenase family protein [Saprospiraceae bacterium]MDP5046814.1 phytanoyl-CoA dioxygenase family protein [Saprospiraceae bacterium]